jgi:hypothetical protein
VLNVEDGKALLLSDKILAVRRYDAESSTWETSEMREYLNGLFYEAVFTADEKALVAESSIKNGPDPRYTRETGGPDTVDKVFLLSVEEVFQYFGYSGFFEKPHGLDDDDNYMGCYIDDEYNTGRIAEYRDTGKQWWWWLRSVGKLNTVYAGSPMATAAFINAGGNIGIEGFPVSDAATGSTSSAGSDRGGVRPALWINLKAPETAADGSGDDANDATSDETATTDSATDSAAANLSAIWLALLCGGILVMLLLFTLAGALPASRRPVLVLLGGIAAQAQGKTKEHSASHRAGISPEHPNIAGSGETGSAVCVEAQRIADDNAVAEYRNRFRPARGGGFGIPALVRFVSRHMRRSAVKSALSAAAALCFTLALGWMPMTIDRIGKEIDSLYDSAVVDAGIVPRNSLATTGAIYKRTVDGIMDSGLVQSAYFETATRLPALAVRSGGAGVAKKPADEIWNVPVCSFSHPERFFPTSGSRIAITYADGWDASLFSSPYTEQARDEPVPIVMPSVTLGKLGLSLGDRAVFIVNVDETEQPCIVAGTYTGNVELGGIPSYDYILLPWEAMYGMLGSDLIYVVAEFAIDPARNRDIASMRDGMRALVEAPDAGLSPLLFMIWDEELRMAVEPMEKSQQLLMALYPVAIAISMLIAAGLALLLTLQKAKDAAVMRVLGTTKTRIRAALCAEHAAVCLAGLILGLAASAAIWHGIPALQGGSLMCAALYFAGCLLGSTIASVLVTARKPLELLQVKE